MTWKEYTEQAIQDAAKCANADLAQNIFWAGVWAGKALKEGEIDNETFRNYISQAAEILEKRLSHDPNCRLQF